jgi:endoribonuclease Dicer
VIDWDMLRYVTEKEAVTVPENAPDDFFISKYVTDPSSGARKFFLRGKRPDLQPRDPLPAGVSPPSGLAWKDAPKDILNYSVGLWKQSRLKMEGVWREDQPVVEAEIVSLRRNLLDEHCSSHSDEKRDLCFLVLEPLRISAVGFLLHQKNEQAQLCFGWATQTGQSLC